MTTETYNGWTNYATWGVALVLDNDEWTYTEVRDRAQQLVAQARTQASGLASDISTAEQAAMFELADWLKDFTEQLCGLEGDSDDLGIPEPSLMAKQVIAAGLADVDWHEIAENVLSGLE